MTLLRDRSAHDQPVRVGRAITPTRIAAAGLVMAGLILSRA